VYSTDFSRVLAQVASSPVRYVINATNNRRVVSLEALLIKRLLLSSIVTIYLYLRSSSSFLRTRYSRIDKGTSLVVIDKAVNIYVIEDALYRSVEERCKRLTLYREI
jgi:hypothetical protein